MSWYSHEFFPILLYGPPAVAGVLTVQLITSKLVKPHKRPYLERSSLFRSRHRFQPRLLGMNAFGIGSAYLMALASFTFTIVTTLNDFVIIGIGAIEEKLLLRTTVFRPWIYPVMTIIPAPSASKVW